MAVVQKIQVAVWDCSWRAQRLAQSMNRHQTRYELTCFDSADDSGLYACEVSLYLAPNPFALFSVSREDGVRLSTDDCGPISRYLGVTEDDYLLMGALLGLSQWRVLDFNPLIRPEDGMQCSDNTCLYAPRNSVRDYALVLEQAHVCSSCRQFYRCLGVETELCLIQEFAERFNRSAA